MYRHGSLYTISSLNRSRNGLLEVLRNPLNVVEVRALAEVNVGQHASALDKLLLNGGTGLLGSRVLNATGVALLVVEGRLSSGLPHLSDVVDHGLGPVQAAVSLLSDELGRKTIVDVVLENLVTGVDTAGGGTLDGVVVVAGKLSLLLGVVGQRVGAVNVVLDGAVSENLGSLDTTDTLDGTDVGATTKGNGLDTTLDAQHLRGKCAGRGADTVVDHDDILGGEGLGQVGELSVAGNLNAETVGSIGGGQRVGKVPAHQGSVVGLLEDVGSELVLEGLEGIVGKVQVVAVVEPRGSILNGVSVVAGSSVQVGSFVAENLGDFKERLGFLPAGETILLNLGEELAVEVVAEQNVTTTVALEVNNNLLLAIGLGLLDEVMDSSLELSRAVALESGQDKDGDIIDTFARKVVTRDDTLAVDQDRGGVSGKSTVDNLASSRESLGRGLRRAELLVVRGTVNDTVEVAADGGLVLEADGGSINVGDGGVGTLVDEAGTATSLEVTLGTSGLKAALVEHAVVTRVDILVPGGSAEDGLKVLGSIDAVDLADRLGALGVGLEVLKDLDDRSRGTVLRDRDQSTLAAVAEGSGQSIGVEVHVTIVTRAKDSLVKVELEISLTLVLVVDNVLADLGESAEDINGDESVVSRRIRLVSSI